MQDIATAQNINLKQNAVYQQLLQPAKKEKTMRKRDNKGRFIKENPLPSDILMRYNWTKEWPALNHKGDPVEPTDPTAVRFCTTGAIQKAAWERTGRNEQKTRSLASEWEYELLCSLRPEWTSIDAWNDQYCKDKRYVIRALKRIDL